MTSDGESREIRDYLFENPEHLDTALAVFETWGSIRGEVYQQFLKRLPSRILGAQPLQRYASDLRVASVYGGVPAKSNYVWLHRERWAPYSPKDPSKPSQTNHRVAIMLRAEGRLLRDWFIGVQIPKSPKEMNDAERARRSRYDQELLNRLGPTSGSGDWWPWWTWVDSDKWHWNSLVPALHRECQADEDGEITRYFLDTFVEIARKAIPVIDGIES